MPPQLQSWRLVQSKLASRIAFSFILIILITLSGCGYLREQSYQRLDKKHAEQVDQALAWFQESGQFLQVGSFEEAIAKAKLVQEALSEAIKLGQDALDLANEIYDEWTTTFLRQRGELEETYLAMAKLVENTAVALKEGDQAKAKQSLQAIEELKQKADALLQEVETLQKLRDEASKMLVPRLDFPANFGQQPKLIPTP